LELQSVFERAFRRARLPMAFSAGFHPMPRLSFGKALPVGVESRCEWINVFLREDFGPDEVIERLGRNMPKGLAPFKAQRLSMGRKQPQAVEEVYVLRLVRDNERRREQWQTFLASEHHFIEKKTKKGKLRQVDLRPMVRETAETEQGLTLVLDWREQYMSPLALCAEVMEGATLLDFSLTKTEQRFGPETP
jgi:radical SAM-linked protein